MNEDEIMLDEVPSYIDNSWSIQGVWNEAVGTQNERETTLRTAIWASELGKNYWERYQKMIGNKPKMEFAKRIKRVMFAGNVIERMCAYVLKSAGILMEDNERYELQADGLLSVTVRPDLVGGGTPSWEAVQKSIESDPMWQFFPQLQFVAKKLCENLQQAYQGEIPPLVYEVKSLHSNSFWGKVKSRTIMDAYPHHKLQLFAGMKAKGVREGRLLYISRDDLTMQEFPIFADDPVLNELYKKDVEQMSYYIQNQIEPPKPENIVFDPNKKFTYVRNKEKIVVTGCYVPNWEVQRSLYIEELTGYKSADEFKREMEKECRVKNASLKDK